MEKMKKLFDRVLEVSCIALMSVMTILVTYQVITRYIFNKPSACLLYTSDAADD